MSREKVRILRARILWTLPLVLSLNSAETFAGHPQENPQNNAAREHWDFTTNDGFSCRWVGGAGNGMECEDAFGSGFSTTCEYKPDICKQGVNSMPRERPKVKPPQENKPPSAYANNANSEQNADNAAKIGQHLSNQDQSLGTIAPNGAPMAGNMLKPQRSQGAPNAQNLQENLLTQQNDNIKALLQDPRLIERLANLSETDFNEIETTLKDLQKNLAALPAEIAAQQKKSYDRLRLALWHAKAHHISRFQVMQQLPQNYFASDGVYEKPRVTKTLNLIAEDGMPMLLRDVSIVEECQRSGVRHVEMIKQCSDLQFEKVRRFKI